MTELTKRILFASPAAVFFIFLTWLGSFYFVGVIVVITLFIQRELSLLSSNAGFEPDRFFPYTFGLWILLSPFLPHPLLIGFVIFLLFIAVQMFRSNEQAIKNLFSTFFTGIYAPLGLLAIILVRDLGSTQFGFVLTLSLLLMVWGNDIFAYFGGKYLGKKKLAPSISPNKTWEGFFFGILGALVGLAITYYSIPFDLSISFVALAPVALLISVFGPIGDLTASRIKRAANAKDASKILPGHGGFFDRFDALILASPVFYSYLYALQIFGYVNF